MNSDINQLSFSVYIVYLSVIRKHFLFFFFNFFSSSLKHLDFDLGNTELQLFRDLASYRLEVHTFLKNNNNNKIIY